MKKIIALFCIIFSIMILSSCEDLEPKSYGKLGSGNYPKNQEDITTFITGVYGDLNRGSYSSLGDVSTQSRWALNTATTDEFFCFWGGNVWDTYRYFQWTASSVEVWAKTFANYFKTISQCVNGIYYMDQIEMDSALKIRYTGELKCIMAFLSYYLYDFYGPVPIVTDPEITLNSSNMHMPERPTKEWIINFIKTYGREAAGALPLKYDTKDYGRMTKGTALMVLLKLAMHEKDWAEASTISKEIMDLGVYQLQDRYISVFSVDNEMNSEIILAVPESVDNNRYNNWLAHVLPDRYVEPNGYPIQKWGGYKVPWEMYEKYWDKTGKPVYSKIGDQRLEAVWDSLNTKNGMVFLRDSINAKGWEWTSKGAVPYKYPVDPNGIGEPQGNDYVIFRYADVLLLRAEALNNLSPLSSEAIALVNEIRGRAKTTLVSASDFSNGAAFNDFILDERFRELFLEGTRREDLIRHGKYLEEAQKRGAIFYDETRLLFPFPQWVIDQMGGKGQNPGY